MPETPTLLLVPAPDRGFPAITRQTPNVDIINQLAALAVSKAEEHLRKNEAPTGITVHVALREDEKRCLKSACKGGRELRAVLNGKIHDISSAGRIPQAKLKYTYAVYQNQGYSFTFRPV